MLWKNEYTILDITLIQLFNKLEISSEFKLCILCENNYYKKKILKAWRFTPKSNRQWSASTKKIVIQLTNAYELVPDSPKK